MQEVFEKIIEKLEEYEYENLVEHDSEQSQHCKDAGDCKGMDCPLCVFNKAIEIVKQEAELKKMEEMRAIEYELHSRPELLEFMKLARTWSTEQVQLATEMLLELADSDTSICQAIGA